MDSIDIEDLTITFVCHHYPKKLAGHLKLVRSCQIENVSTGIYYVKGDKIPIQIIVTKLLPKKENLWLRSLTNQLFRTNEIEDLLEDYAEHKSNVLYRSMMNVIVRANSEKFREVKEMCEALEELMKEELEAKKNEGEKEGKKIGQEQVNLLNIRLAEQGRGDDIIKAAKDEKFQRQLFAEFGLTVEE